MPKNPICREEICTLNSNGQLRAESLVEVTKNAGITQIYATQYARTKQTANGNIRTPFVVFSKTPRRSPLNIISKSRAQLVWSGLQNGNYMASISVSA